jgi:hypothetical protein
MRKHALSIAALLAAGPFAAPAATLPPDAPHTALLLVTPDRFEQAFARPRMVESPTLDAGQIHYAARVSGLDRIDPADFKVFGAEIGGNGVQGGAVVSLSWPTER